MGDIANIPSTARSTTLDTYIQRATQAAGLGSDIATPFDDFLLSSAGTALSNWSNGATNGTVNLQVPGARSGMARLSTSATAASLFQAFSNSILIANAGTNKWYFALKAKFPTAIDAQANLSAGLLSTSLTSWIQCGFVGPLNAANFGVQYDGNLGAGSFLNSGVAKDTNYHVFEIYCRGDGVLRFRFDNGAELTATLSAAPTDVLLALQVRNGATPADRQMDVDWVMAAVERTP